MFFGVKEAFAIETMSEPALQAPSAVWGRMRIWCEGERIGDYDEGFCALYPSYCGFKQLASSLSHLWCTELNGLTDIQLWNHLDGLLYGYHGDVELQDDRTLEQCERDAEKWGGYNFLTNWGEQFDIGGKSFIVCKPGDVVCVLNRSFQPGRGIAACAPLKEVLATINQYIAWFESESSRLGFAVNA
ncbi:hypothetical protein [Ottowia thiooxydans]|uniref:hypothetical protein n=1 Tax=Ottowia thiooxydans TaxID=219182 RepID=UPI00048E567B|nr:hypothetical protein [Ottowia thiooxydans]